MASVLLVEDDEHLGDSVTTALRAARFDVRWVRDGTTAIAAAERSGWDVVILDLGLPDLDGVDVCRAIRARLSGAVIVILTARDTEVDIVVGLEAGADDYLVKPVRSTELVARLRAHLRRTTTPSQTNAVTIGALRVDPAGRRAWLGDHELELRSKQFDLLCRLAASPEAAVSRSTLMADVWDEHWFGSTKTLDVHVAELRRVLAEAGATQPTENAPEIVTLRGFGYRLQASDGRHHSSRARPERADGGDEQPDTDE